MPLNQPVLSGPRAVRAVTYGSGSSAKLKLAGEQSGGDWVAVEWRLRAGDEPPLHTHTREDETLYVLEGEITAYVGDQRIDVEAGSYAALPTHVPHGLTVRGQQARLLITLVPAGAEYFLVPRDDADAEPGRFRDRHSRRRAGDVRPPRRDVVCPAVYVTMTVAEARREYRRFMSRMDVAFAFGHGCSIAGSHPVLRGLRDEADRLLVQLRALEAAAGERPLNPPGRGVRIEFCRQ